MNYKGVDDPNQYAVIHEETRRTTQLFVYCVQHIEQSIGHRIYQMDKPMLVSSDSQDFNTDFKRERKQLGMDVADGA